MEKEEFTKLAGEEFADDYDTAERIYLSLPTMTKQTFCRLWRFCAKSGLNLFERIDQAWRDYDATCRANPHLRKYFCEFHNMKGVKEEESRLMRIFNALNR